MKITTTETSETKIIGHMEKLLIEHETDGKIKPTLIGNLGSSIIQHNALQRGDAKCMYIHRYWTSVLAATYKDPDENNAYLKRNMMKSFIIHLRINAYGH